MINRILERLEAERVRYDNVAMASNHVGNYEMQIEYIAKTEMCESAIEIVQEEADKGGWIPTEWELFPRMGQMVIASVNGADAKHEIIITQYKNQDYWHDGKITAWMPLPPVYQKGE